MENHRDFSQHFDTFSKMFFAAEEYDSDYNGELDFWEFRKVLRTPGMTKKLGFLGVGPDEAESLCLG